MAASQNMQEVHLVSAVSKLRRLGGLGRGVRALVRENARIVIRRRPGPGSRPTVLSLLLTNLYHETGGFPTSMEQ